MEDNAQRAPAPAGQLTFDGDRATFTFTVTAPSTPFTVQQTAACPSTPTVGVPATCTITETVTNGGNHTLDFSHTVNNHLPQNVRAVSATTATGTIVTSGTSVVWSSFQLAPHQSAMASIQVAFTPTSAQVGSTVELSTGITATALDAVTGQRYVQFAGMLATPARVVAPSAPSTPAQLPATGGGAALANQMGSRPRILPLRSSPGYRSYRGHTARRTWRRLDAAAGTVAAWPFADRSRAGP